MIIIGSTAMNKFESSWRSPKDFDYFYVDEPIVKLGDGHKIPENVYNKVLEFTEKGFLTPEGYYNLKMSHFQFDIRWDKTKADIISLQNRFGFGKVDKDFFDVLYNHWLTTVKNRKHKINLSMENDEFFDDAVKRIYDHDELHEIMALHDEPLYKKILKQPDKPSVDYKKFLALPENQQLDLCREETYVISMERFVLPSDFAYSGLDAYRQSQKKLITNMTKGWFPLFYTENLNKLRMPHINFVDYFKERNDDKH